MYHLARLRSGNADFLDVTGDQLADVRHRAFEQEMMGHLVRVSALDACCVRLDTTTVSSDAEVSEEGLLCCTCDMPTITDQTCRTSPWP